MAESNEERKALLLEPSKDSSSASEREEEEEKEDWEDDCTEDDENDDDDRFWKDIFVNWKQHCIAVLVAVVATAVAYYSRSSSSSSTTTPMGTTPMAAPTAILFSKHAYLDDYRRTANISFCGTIINNDDHRPPAPTSLHVFDFTVPKDLIPTMHLHFAADDLQDDHYDKVLSDDDVDDDHRVVIVAQRELDCMQRMAQAQDNTNRLVKGLAFYFKKPAFESMYRNDDDDKKKKKKHSVMIKKSPPHPAHLTFAGFAAKFINLSPQPVLLFWDGRNERERKLVGEIPPFESLGTATTPGNPFSVSPVYDSSLALATWVVTADDCLLYYEPSGVASTLSGVNRKLYQMQKLNKEFAKHYLIHSGRTWLSEFPRPLPLHFMWEASYFGQTHTVKSDHKELELTVVSVTPRVFVVRHFLSHEECHQLIRMAMEQGMKGSRVHSGGSMPYTQDLSTRSSSNTWLEHSSGNLTDQIYKRAAQLLKIDEALVQAPMDDSVHAHHHSIAESLQVVRYKKGEEYTAHHDFVYPSQRHRLQPTRFATVLMYLNDNFEGGETVFPRAVNAQYHDGIKVQLEKGTAVLFYDVLPDGNVDDLSQHFSQPIESGQKFLANLWIWEPVIN